MWKIIYAHVFIPLEPGRDEGDVCRSGKQLGVGGGQGFQESVRGRRWDKISGCFLIVVGGGQVPDLGQDPGIWVISAGRCGWEIWIGSGEEPKWLETVILASPKYPTLPLGLPFG